MSKNSDSKLFAFLGIFLTIIGFIIVILARKKDKYAMYYAKQGLILFIAAIIVGIVGWAVAWLPLVGGIISFGFRLVWLILWIIGMVYSLSGKQQEIPFIGSFSKEI